MFTHARIDSDLTENEKNQLATFGKMGSTALYAENGLILIYRIVKKTLDISVW